MQSSYKNLVSVERLRRSTGPTDRSSMQEIGSDRGRILFSSPIRRLQSKAQVFSLEDNAAVRSRLTHSLEVSHIGRYIVQRVTHHAENTEFKGLLGECAEIEAIIETACLLHDIGNPPFGHLGESAIQDWFTSNAAELYDKSMKCKGGKSINKSSPYYKDFEKFDGNPQGLRICLKLQGKPEKNGFNLTLSQIASIVKYPQTSTDIIQYKKIGAFRSEADLLKDVWKKLNLKWGERHPLVYLMEAADDIAYCLSDIEDGIEKNIITEKMVIDELKCRFCCSQFPEYSTIVNNHPDDSVTKPFVNIRTQLINNLVDYAAHRFVTRLKSNDLGDPKPLFDGDDEACRVINSIKKYCRENLYSSPEAEDVEISGYNIVFGLLDKFSILLSLSQTDFEKIVHTGKGSSLCCRMYSKLPKNLVEHYKYSVQCDSDAEWFHRVQLIVDYVSGMTDVFALRFFKLVNGIEVKVL